MSPDPSRLRDLFAEASELDGAAQAGFLEEHCAGDKALRHAVEKLLAADREAENETLWRGSAIRAEAREQASEEALPFKELGPYRILSRIGSGGMGAVYLAERDYDDVRRQVAIKVIPRALMDEETEERFRQERRILARMEHPNIARMLDAGRTPDGMPYLVMEYVDGIALDRYAESSQLNLQDRVSLFRVVADAVAYAHRNLVVHRDLKPQNILVTKEGVPKLLDFGIAKMLSAARLDDITTRPLMAMTLDYASPEQVRGMPVTTACDVYSLGVVLYQLLTGRKPYSLAGKPLEEILRVVCKDEPPAPASINRALAGDLNAIALKAIRKEAAERYASAGELSRDLGHYLSGEPVLASGLSLAYLTRKYIARHHTQAAAAIAAAVLIVGGVAAIATEAQIANRERAKAQRRFDDLRMLASDMVFQTNDTLAKFPGTTGARKELVERGQLYLDALSKESSGDATLERDVGAAYVRLGDIQGNHSVANLGDAHAALASYQKARALLTSAMERKPGDMNARLELVNMYDHLSTCYASLGRYDDALKAGQEAVATAEGAVRADPSSERARKGLADAYFDRAITLRTSDEAVRTWRKCLELYRAFLQKNPQGDSELRNMALVHKYLAGVLMSPAQRDSGNLKLAIGEALEAEKLDRQRLVARPGSGEAQLDLTFDLNQAAISYETAGDLKNALDKYLQALAIRRTLLDSDPMDVRKRAGVVYDEMAAGWLLLSLGRFEEAASHYRKVEPVAGGAEQLRNKVAGSFAGLGAAADGLHRPAEACGWFRRAVALLPHETSPFTKEWKDRLSSCR